METCSKLSGKTKDAKEKPNSFPPSTKRFGNVVTKSLCTCQWRRRYVLNETPNSVSMERRQYVSVVCLHDVLLDSCSDVSKDLATTSFQYVSTTSQTSFRWNIQQRLSGRYQDVWVVRIHDVRLARLYDISCKSQIKHPKTLLRYVSTTSGSYVFAISC